MLDGKTARYAINKAKEYADDQRLAYSENSDGTISFDGDMTDKVVLSCADLGVSDGENHVMVRVTNQVIPLQNVEVVTLEAKYSGDKIYVPHHIEETDGTVFLFCTNGAITHPVPLAMTIPSDAGAEVSGTYFLVQASVDDNATIYVHKVRGTICETIHTIDPKFLPEPVVIDLADYGMELKNGSNSAHTEILTLIGDALSAGRMVYLRGDMTMTVDSGAEAGFGIVTVAVAGYRLDADGKLEAATITGSTISTKDYGIYVTAGVITSMPNGTIAVLFAGHNIGMISLA